MSVKLLTEHIFEFLSLKEAAQARLSLHLSKCHIVRNHILRLNRTYERVSYVLLSIYICKWCVEISWKQQNKEINKNKNKSSRKVENLACGRTLSYTCTFVL